MRVIAGTARGRRLQAPAGEAVRPTADRVREAIFNMVLSRVDLDGAAVVDLFAGTGAMGIEALSRGAARATFVDHDRRALVAIRANVDATGVAGRATVVHGDVLHFLEGLAGRSGGRIPPPTRRSAHQNDEGGEGAAGGGAAGGGAAGGDRFDVAFVDPPYAFDRWDELFSLLPARLVVAESDREVAPGAGWSIVKVRRYGGTVVTLAAPAGDDRSVTP